MKKLIAGLALLLVVTAVVVWCKSTSVVAPRTVKLTITGSKGENFEGSYVANNKASSLTGVVPTTITVSANALTYAFKPSDAGKGFRVALNVDGQNRTSFLSYKGGIVKGGWYYSSYEDCSY
jgi:hypothetical protein